MRWEDDAAQAMSRVPFFVRGLAKRKVEELVAAEGRDEVTLADVRRAKDRVMPGGPDGPVAASPSPDAASETAPGVGAGPMAVCRAHCAPPESSLQAGAVTLVPAEASTPVPSAAAPTEGLSGLTEAQIRDIERIAASLADHESRYYSVRGCGGAAGCPLAMVDVRQATEGIVAAIEASGLSEVQAARLKGPVLSHHKLKAAVAGCPNCCSEPQIKDFALVARSRPALGPGECISCGTCESACKEAAVRVLDAGPALDPERCVGCGGCAADCPSGSIVAGRRGYDVLVGGRLGRHPRLATTVAEGVTEAEALDLLRGYLDLLEAEGQPGERLGALLERTGRLAWGPQASSHSSTLWR